MADAIGKPAAGTLIYNTGWIGHYEECTSKQYTLHEYKYCTVQMTFSGGALLPVSTF